MDTTESTRKDAEDQARAQLASIREMVAGLDPVECEEDGAACCGRWHPSDFDHDEHEVDEGENTFDTEDDCRECWQQRIREDALSVEVRSGWTTPGETLTPEEFNILLCTGGPAVRIVGDLNDGEPDRCRLECQGWFIPWTEVLEGVDSADREIMRRYASELLGGVFE